MARTKLYQRVDHPVIGKNARSHHSSTRSCPALGYQKAHHHLPDVALVSYRSASGNGCRERSEIPDFEYGGLFFFSPENHTDLLMMILLDRGLGNFC